MTDEEVGPGDEQGRASGFKNSPQGERAGCLIYDPQPTAILRQEAQCRNRKQRVKCSEFHDLNISRESTSHTGSLPSDTAVLYFRD